MRLLNIHSYEFREFHGENIPPYIIASHRWTDDETTFKDVSKKRNTGSKGWRKIEGFCERARRDNELLGAFEDATCCEWTWIDTACIDKRSSAEVSESINSMMQWYAASQECHAYMADVKPFPASQQLAGVLDDFKSSEWFTRGWTLQELLAPRCVVFFTQSWQIIGHKCSYCSATQSCEGAGPLLNHVIAEVTGIPEDVLQDYERSKSIPIEEKMKWQVGRRTTRIEDRAYCLLGLFGVHMPLLYGEGEKAMLRLERTVCEELERPWRSQLRLNFNDPTDTQAEGHHHGSTRLSTRPGRPLAIMRYSNVEGEVSCICGYVDDDGDLVACDICQSWQHALCYFPHAVQEGLSEDQEHGCVKCRPRNLDAAGAASRQQEKRAIVSSAYAVVEERTSVPGTKRVAPDGDDSDEQQASKRQRNTDEGPVHTAGRGSVEETIPGPVRPGFRKRQLSTGSNSADDHWSLLQSLKSPNQEREIHESTSPEEAEASVDAPSPQHQQDQERPLYFGGSEPRSFAPHFDPGLSQGWQNQVQTVDFGEYQPSSLSSHLSPGLSQGWQYEQGWSISDTTQPWTAQLSELPLEPNSLPPVPAYEFGDLGGTEYFDNPVNNFDFFDTQPPMFVDSATAGIPSRFAFDLAGPEISIDPAPPSSLPEEQRSENHAQASSWPVGMHPAYDPTQYTWNRDSDFTSSSQARSTAPAANMKFLPAADDRTGSAAFARAPIDDFSREKRERCPVANCGRYVRDLKAHMGMHQMERPEKCPIPTCEYHTRGFARKYDLNRHVLTHFKGEMVCGFCDRGDGRAPKSFDRADVFRRHLTSVHGVIQALRPTDTRASTSSTAASEGRSGVCSTCTRAFGNAQDFYDHLDECTLRTVEPGVEDVSFTCSHPGCASSGVSFAYRKDLERHARSQHGSSHVELYDCPHAGCERKGERAFTRKDKLLDHQRLTHGEGMGRRARHVLGLWP